MANEIKVTYKGKKHGDSSVTIEELPNIGDTLQFPGEQPIKVLDKTFHYDEDGNVIGVQFD
ncbi:hypothetical protein [Pseudomonas sp. DWRC2-2]|uniref:hypothetical protein n=1 Tax=Pseudomonas sp. DWRC2-2 TaxID=2804567 RepID=UPI003CEDEDA1